MLYSHRLLDNQECNLDSVICKRLSIITSTCFICRLDITIASLFLFQILHCEGKKQKKLKCRLRRLIEEIKISYTVIFDAVNAFFLTSCNHLSDLKTIK